MDPQSDAEGGSGHEPSLELLSHAQLHAALPTPGAEGPAEAPEACGERRGPGLDAAARERQLQRELLALKQQQQLQKQLLFAEFQKQHEHLTRQHEVQLQKHLKQQQEALAARRQQELEQQRQRERQEALEQQQRLEQLHALRTKDKSRESAIASTEVKLKLQEFLLSKTKEPGTGPPNHSLPQHPKCCGVSAAFAPPPRAHHTSLDQSSPPQTGSPGTPPSYKLPLLGTYDGRDDFPLRKTASEPNLKVRSRLKQKVAERRSSPLLRRKDGTVISTFKKRAIEITVSSVCSSAPGSGPSSPNSSHSAIAENGFTGSVPNIHAELLPQPRALTLDGASQLSLYTSPSLPNISLGLQATVTVTNSHLNASPKLSPQAEAERPAVAALRPGAALTGKFLSTSSIPGCLLGVALEGDPPAGPASLLQHVLLLEQARQQSTLIAVPLHGQSPLVTGERAGNARPVSKLPRHRPLSRTQSSPLPQSPQALPHGALPHGALPHGALQHHFLDKQQVQLGKLLPKPGELARQPPTHPEETEEELTEQQSPPPGDGVPPGPPLASPDAGDPPEQLQDPEGCGVPHEEPGDSGDEAETPGVPDVTELGVTYKQMFPEAPLQLYPAPTLGILALPHPALARTQSSPASAGVKPPAPDGPPKHLFTTAPMHLRQHQRPPRARRAHPEHLVPAAGDRAPRQVRAHPGQEGDAGGNPDGAFGASHLALRHQPPQPPEARQQKAPGSHQPEDVRGAAVRGHRGGQRHGVERDAFIQRRAHGGGVPGGARLQGGRRRDQERLRRHPPPGTPRRGVHGHGLLFLQLGGHLGQTAPAEAQRGQDPHRGLGHPPRERHPTSLLQRPRRPLHLPPPLRRWQLLPGQRGARGGRQRDGSGLQHQHRLDRRRRPPHRGRGVSHCLQDRGDAHRQRVLPGRGAGLGRLRRRRGSPLPARRLLRHRQMFRPLDEAADDAGGGAGGAGAGGGARPDGHLRRLGGLRLRSARPGVGAPGSVPPAAEAKRERGGHPGEGHRDPEQALGLGEAPGGGRGLLLAGGAEGGGGGSRDGDGHGPALGGRRAGGRRPPAQAGGGADGGRARAVTRRPPGPSPRFFPFPKKKETPRREEKTTATHTQITLKKQKKKPKQKNKKTP
ncbi:histone deacetylase 5 isoform X3 [Calonectris borealis]|uniref:histone deacetylase 5 isoform X3 n=1 Tax=Calonectris borealis TaxID=1323832 RepID=UPI003F4BD966